MSMQSEAMHVRECISRESKNIGRSHSQIIDKAIYDLMSRYINSDITVPLNTMISSSGR